MSTKNMPCSHKQMAVACFNKVWEFLDKNERTPYEEEEMVHLCHTSFWHWTQVEDHTQQNISIGYWQLSRVYAIVGNGEQAMKFAERCVTISTAAELAPFYIAYAYEAQARAQILLKQKEKVEESLRLARQHTEIVKNAESQKLLLADIEELERMKDEEIK